MNIRFLWAALTLATAAQAAPLDLGMSYPSELKPLQQQSQAAHLAAELLTRYHYKAMPLDDLMSEKIFDNYLKSLDSERIYFLQTDIDQLASARTKLDDAILKEDLSLPFAIFNRYARRVSDHYSYVRRLLKTGFDFRQKEGYQTVRDKEPWPASEQEMHDLWRKRVKNDWLRLRLAGKNDASIAEILDKRYEHSAKRIARIRSEDVFQAFMNAYTMAIEPHTNYMGPESAENFEISLKLSLVGIGVALAEKDEYATIRELVPGGPASLSGQLKAGDRIVGVAQSTNGPFTDVQGWRLDETVALIRGAADSVVLLDVLPVEASPDGQHKTVLLTRKKITLEDQSAKKSILSVTDRNRTRRIGVIALPTFYQDFEAQQKADPNFKSATRDVARLLNELKQENPDGILIDLRDNGGGSLKEAIELTGLFVPKGPVVQQRDARGEVKVWSDTNLKVAWDGPLAVLINRRSASASEIFAAAIQDYGRGLVIGETSFGKGTVQTVINLDQLARNDTPRLGELKLTIAQFFRINGGTTQLRGVTPDIGFPTIADVENFGESSFGNALPWMQVKAVDYVPAGDLKTLLPILLARHEARAKNNKDLLCLQEDIADAKLQRQKNLVSLNETERRRQRDTQETRRKSCDAGRALGPSDSGEIVGQDGTSGNSRSVRDDGLQADERNIASDLAAAKARKNAKDVLLNEAVHILSDELDLLKSGTRFAVRVEPGSWSKTPAPGTDDLPASVW